jgi:hypothetical protein
MKNATSIILAFVSFVAFALICDDRFYKTGNVLYQIAIIAAILGMIFFSMHKIKEIIK